MAKLTIRGVGQLNGPVIIKMTIEMDDNQANLYRGAGRYKAIVALLAVHYPGVKIEPHKIGIEFK